MKNLRNKRVTKLTVGDLKKALKGINNDTEVVIGLYRKDEPVEFCYLADVFANMKFDSVIKDRLFDASVVELVGYDHKYATYVQKQGDN